MRRVLLLGPCKPTSGVANWGAPPLGIHRLAAWIRHKCGADVDVYDPCLSGLPEPDMFDGYDIIGFSPLAETLAEDINIMHMAHKANSTALLVAGGIEATLNYQDILDKSPVNWIVLGSGERQLEAIVNGVPPGEIDGVIYRSRSTQTTGEDLREYYSQLSFADMGYEDYWKATAAMYDTPNLQDIRTVRLVTSTHCNRGCSFCSVTQWQQSAVGRRVIPGYLDAQEVLELVRRIKCEVPTTETIYFCEDDFCLCRERVLEFCKHSAEIGVSYLVQTHSSRLDRELVAAMANGGVRHITVGIENASPKILQSFNKPQDLSKVPDIIAWCREFGITPYLLIILFAPESTIEDLRMNYEVLSQWMALGAVVSIEPFTMPYRGAPLYDSLHEFEWNISALADGSVLKQPVRILPDDLPARDLMKQFAKRWPAYKEKHARTHSFKGETGRLMVQLLGELLGGARYAQ